MGSFFQELRRRNVYKAATLYMVAGWVLLQVADTVLPSFGFSADSFRTLTMILVAGFPLALILSWLYEITADGIKKTQEQGSGKVATSGGTDIVVIFLLLILVGFTALDEFSDFSRTEIDSAIRVEAPQVVKSSINIGALQPSTGVGGLYSEIAMSPDGSKLAYTAISDQGSGLYLRQLNEEHSSLIVEFDETSYLGITNPVFSNDGDSIFYYTGNDFLNLQITEYSLTSELVQTRIDSATAIGFSVSEDESIWYQAPGFNLYRQNNDIDSGRPILIAEFDALGGKGQGVSLPGGNEILYTTFPSLDSVSQDATDIFLLDLATKEQKLLIEAAYLPRYVSTGHILFMRRGELWAVAFDLESLSLAGEELPVIPDLSTLITTGQTSYSVSENGRMIYVPGESDLEIGLDLYPAGPLNSSLLLVDRNGVASTIDLSGIQPSYTPSRFSPDGSKIAITSIERATESIWIYDIEREMISRLINRSGANPIWSSDGETVYFGMGGIHSIASNGLGDPVQHYSGRAINIEITPDETHFIFDTSDTVTSRARASSDIFSLPISARRDEDLPTPLIATPFNEQDAAISPDGRWIAYASDRSGRSEIYVQPFPSLDDRWQISNSGGYRPQWTSNGSELVYAESMDIFGQNQGSQLMSVEIDVTNGFVAGVPKPLFTIEGEVTDFTASPDGSSFLMSSRGQSDSVERLSKSVSISLIENWFEELKELAPRYP